MKLQTFIFAYLIIATFHTTLTMERLDLLVIDKSTRPFLKDIEGACGWDDDEYTWRVANKTLLMLIIEATSHSHPQNKSAPSSEQYKYKELKRFLVKFDQNLIQLPQIEEEYTQITSRDNHRLLSHIRTLGKSVHLEGGRLCTPVIIGNTIAYLNHKFLSRQDLEHITWLEDFSDNQRVSSRNFEDCQQKVKAILKTY